MMAQASLSVPSDQPLRVVGDVHGDASAFAYAADTDRFLVQLGDLVDYGPDSAGALQIMFDLIDRGRGLFLLGNHDLKLARLLLGQNVRVNAQLLATMEQLDEPLRARVLAEAARAPLWLRSGNRLFVHAGFHTDMLDGPAPPAQIGRALGISARALFGEPTGQIQADGFPERSLRWVNRIPPGMTVYVGHDRRSQDGRLSWIDLPALEG
jgi:protein phosphatase